METKVLFSEINNIDSKLSSNDIESLVRYIKENGVLVLFDNRTSSEDEISKLFDAVDKNYHKNIFIFKEGNHGYNEELDSSILPILPVAKNDVQRGYNRKKISDFMIRYLEKENTLNLYVVGNNPVTFFPIIDSISNRSGESGIYGFDNWCRVAAVRYIEKAKKLGTYVEGESPIDAEDAKIKLKTLVEERQMANLVIFRCLKNHTNNMYSSLCDFMDAVVINPNKKFGKAS